MSRNECVAGAKKIHEVEIINTIVKGTPDTLFICCSSFEDRCRKVPLTLPISNYNCYFSVMFNYYQGEKQNRRFFNREKIYEALTAVTIKRAPAPLDCDRLRSLDGEKKLAEYIKLNGIRENNTVGITIDISTFTKQYILQLLLFISKLLRGNSAVRLLYTEPGVYGKGTFKRLTYGIEDTIIVPRFEGKQVPNGRTALIVFLGYETHRTLAAIEKCEADIIIAIIGKPPYYPEWDVYSIKSHSFILSLPNVLKYEMSARDPNEVRDKLSKLYEEITNDYPNISISPTGTKLQTVGIYEFVRLHPTVRVIYPIPKKYLENYYTTGYGKTLEYIL